KTRASSYPFLADAGSRPRNCSGMEEATGAPSSFADSNPKRLRASGRDGGDVVNRPPSPLTMLLSRHTKRRAFIALLGAATAAWPLTARAQRGEKMRRIGVLVGLGADDSQAQARNAAFLQGLGERGWIVGRNLQIDYRWGGGNARRYRRQAAELVALAPELIVAMGGSVVGPLLQTTRTVPLLFLQVTDPVSSGYVASLARPGGNATGFALFESGISAKWLELLKEIAPRVTRAAVLRDPTVPVGLGQLGAIQSLAPSLKVDISPLGVRDARDIEHAITAFARGSSDGLIVLPSVPTVIHRTLIVTLAAQRKL